MVKLLKRRSEMTKGSDVSDKIDYLQNMGDKLKTLKSDTRVLSDVKAQNIDYAKSLSGSEKDDFIHSFNVTKKLGVSKINRDMYMGQKSGLSQDYLTIGYRVDELKSYLKNVKLNGENIPFNDRAFEEIELLMRDRKISVYEAHLPEIADKTKSLVNDYSKESIQRNLTESVHNIKEKAVVGFVNNHPLSLIEDQLGLREKLEPELKQSISDKDLMTKFEDVHMNVFGSSSNESLSSGMNHDLEMGN